MTISAKKRHVSIAARVRAKEKADGHKQAFYKIITILTTSAVSSSTKFRGGTHLCKLRDTPAARFSF